MKIKFKNVLILFIVFTYISSFSQKKFPTNIDGNIIDSIIAYKKSDKIKKLDSKFYAFDARVIETNSGYQNNPYFLVEFSNGNKIWIASLFKSKYIRVGNNLKLLGIFKEIDQTDTVSRSFNDTKYHILLFALVDNESGADMFLKEEKEIGINWMNGIINERLKPYTEKF